MEEVGEGVLAKEYLILIIIPSILGLQGKLYEK